MSDKKSVSFGNLMRFIALNRRAFKLTGDEYELLLWFSVTIERKHYQPNLFHQLHYKSQTISDALGMKRPNVSRALTGLTRKGFLESIGLGKNNRKAYVFSSEFIERIKEACNSSSKEDFFIGLDTGYSYEDGAPQGPVDYGDKWGELVSIRYNGCINQIQQLYQPDTRDVSIRYNPYYIESLPFNFLPFNFLTRSFLPSSEAGDKPKSNVGAPKPQLRVLTQPNVKPQEIVKELTKPASKPKTKTVNGGEISRETIEKIIQRINQFADSERSALVIWNAIGRSELLRKEETAIPTIEGWLKFAQGQPFFRRFKSPAKAQQIFIEYVEVKHKREEAR